MRRNLPKQTPPQTPRVAPRRAQSGLYWALVLGVVLLGCTERRQVRLVEEADQRIGRSGYAEGAEILKRAITVNPESRTAVKALYKLGFLQETYLRDFEGALVNYQEFMRLSSDPVAGYEVRKRAANLYFEQTADPEKAVKIYSDLLASHPDTLEGDFFQFRIGQSLFRINEFERAREEYQKLLAQYPRSHLGARTRFEIGNAYYMEGLYEVALEAFRQVIRSHPQSEYAVEAQFLIAQCQEHLGRLPAALRTYESLRERYSPQAVVDLRIEELRRRAKKVK